MLGTPLEDLGDEKVCVSLANKHLQVQEKRCTNYIPKTLVLEKEHEPWRTHFTT